MIAALQAVAEKIGFGCNPQKGIYARRAEDCGGWMTEAELQFLRDMAENCNSVIEIGSWKGRSTFALAESCPVVHAVDHWTEQEVYKQFRRNMHAFNNVTTYRMPSLQAVSLVPDCDMVFLDGSHSYEDCLVDLQSYGPKALRVICGHDYNWPGVRRAVTEQLGPMCTGAGSIWWRPVE